MPIVSVISNRTAKVGILFEKSGYFVGKKIASFEGFFTAKDARFFSQGAQGFI